MQNFSEKIDDLLIDLAWSLWTELGVAGAQRRHQNVLISPEELILLTAAIGTKDPRLRDEALDWCSRHHDFISVSRLKTLIKDLKDSIADSFSLFSATLHSMSSVNWPVSQEHSPLKIKLSGKSKLPELSRPALLMFRLRALFGVGSRADLIVFFLLQEEKDFAISDTVEIGYSKRNLAEMLEGFAQSGIFHVTMDRNHQRYQFIKQKEFIKILGPIPQITPSWRHFLEVVLKLRNCIQRNEKKTEDTRVVELRNVLFEITPSLRRLHLTSPPMQADFQAYWTAFANWFLNWLSNFALNQ